MNLGNIRAQGISRYLRVMPVDGEKYRRVTQHAEVECVVRVLPDILAAEHCPLAEGLLQASVEFVAVAWGQGPRDAGSAAQQRRHHRIRTSCAGQHQVLVE